MWNPVEEPKDYNPELDEWFREYYDQSREDEMIEERVLSRES